MEKIKLIIFATIFFILQSYTSFAEACAGGKINIVFSTRPISDGYGDISILVTAMEETIKNMLVNSKDIDCINFYVLMLPEILKKDVRNNEKSYSHSFAKYQQLFKINENGSKYGSELNQGIINRLTTSANNGNDEQFFIKGNFSYKSDKKIPIQFVNESYLLGNLGPEKTIIFHMSDSSWVEGWEVKKELRRTLPVEIKKKFNTILIPEYSITQKNFAERIYFATINFSPIQPNASADYFKTFFIVYGSGFDQFYIRKTPPLSTAEIKTKLNDDLKLNDSEALFRYLDLDSEPIKYAAGQEQVFASCFQGYKERHSVGQYVSYPLTLLFGVYLDAFHGQQNNKNVLLYLDQNSFDGITDFMKSNYLDGTNLENIFSNDAQYNNIASNKGLFLKFKNFVSNKISFAIPKKNIEPELYQSFFNAEIFKYRVVAGYDAMFTATIPSLQKTGVLPFFASRDYMKYALNPFVEHLSGKFEASDKTILIDHFTTIETTLFDIFKDPDNVRYDDPEQYFAEFRRLLKYSFLKAENWKVLSNKASCTSLVKEFSTSLMNKSIDHFLAKTITDYLNSWQKEKLDPLYYLVKNTMSSIIHPKENRSNQSKAMGLLEYFLNTKSSHSELVKKSLLDICMDSSLIKL